MGIGSWPRPRWLLQAMHEHAEDRLAAAAFEAVADDAVRLAVAAQVRSGVDLVTDGEQRRRDSYASFVGGRLDNCELGYLTDPQRPVDDPDKLAAELRALDAPAARVRYPAIVGPLGRSRPLAVHEHEFLRTLTARPAKVALPGPYVLTRLMWIEGIADRSYRSREHLAEDVVRVLREELHALLAAGVALVQLDEPVSDAAFELAFARRLLDQVLAGLPRTRLALHVCRGNWTRDKPALASDYRSLLPLLAEVPIGTIFLEMCTAGAGDLDVLRALSPAVRVGVGVVDQRRAEVESVDEIAARARRAVALFGWERVLFTPDCGFASFADSTMAPAGIAEAKLRAMVEAVELVQRG